MSTKNPTTRTTVSQINISTQKATAEAEYKALKTGIETELHDVTSFMIRKKTYAKADLLAECQAMLDALEKTKTDRTALHASVAAERDVKARVGPLRSGFKQYLLSRYGQDAPELQKFGFTPIKTPQRSVAGKAAGVALNKATRVARSTKGKKQKLSVKGTPTPAPKAPPTGGILA